MKSRLYIPYIDTRYTHTQTQLPSTIHGELLSLFVFLFFSFFCFVLFSLYEWKISIHYSPRIVEANQFQLAGVSHLASARNNLCKFCVLIKLCTSTSVREGTVGRDFFQNQFVDRSTKILKQFRYAQHSGLVRISDGLSRSATKQTKNHQIWHLSFLLAWHGIAVQGE